MAEILNKNPELNTNLNDQLVRRGIDEQNPPLIPVFVTNDNLYNQAYIVKYNILNNGTSANLYTTPNRDDVTFFITGYSLSVIKDATATSTLASIQASINSVTQVIAGIGGLSLTAQNQTITGNFNHPIPIDKNTTITLNASTNTANVSVTGVIYGFLSARRPRRE